MRSGRALIAVLAALALQGWPPLAGAQAALETEVKATYLYKIAPFVTWPQSASAGKFAICVVGADPFGPLLDRAVAGQTVAGHAIVVRRLPAAERDASCQMAFVAGSRSQSVAEALRVLRGAPVLTVTQTPASPGMIDLRVVGGRVRFAVDLGAASQSGLGVSSKLLSLAVSVSGKAEIDR
jgi:hypothetical protein